MELIKWEDDKKITLLILQGTAFSNMRARGAMTTDIIILVVAADDSLKPQTMNLLLMQKLQKYQLSSLLIKWILPSADADKVRNDLLGQEIIVEK